LISRSHTALSFAQFEREVIGERGRDKIAASKRQGTWVGGPVPLGYRCIDTKLVVTPEEAETVRIIFQRYLDLGSMGALIEDLNRRGIRTKAGCSAPLVTALAAIVVATVPAEVVTSPVNAGMRAASSVPELRFPALPAESVVATVPTVVVTSPVKAGIRPAGKVPLEMFAALVVSMAVCVAASASALAHWRIYSRTGSTLVRWCTGRASRRRA
jgi:hypothetical protein